MRRRTLIAGVGLAGGPFVATAVAQVPGGSERLLDGFAATLGAHDIDGFAALFADDYVNHQMSAAAPAPPTGKTQKQATVDFFAARLAGIPDLQVVIEAAVVSADRFAASFAYSGTHGGPLFGIPPTGRRLRFTSCDIFRVAEGRIAEHWGMGDIAGVLAQIRG